MEYREFGQTGITVSVLGIGCWDAAAASSWSKEFSDQMSATVNRAIDQGITCFDTAPNYGGENRCLCWAEPWANAVKTW